MVSIYGGPNAHDAVYRVDPSSGQRTLLADFGDPDQGDVYDFPRLFPTAGLLISVDAVTGERTLLSDFGDPAQGAEGWEPTGIVRSPAILRDGFESGDTSAWSSNVP